MCRVSRLCMLCNTECYMKYSEYIWTNLTIPIRITIMSASRMIKNIIVHIQLFTFEILPLQLLFFNASFNWNSVYFNKWQYKFLENKIKKLFLSEIQRSKILKNKNSICVEWHGKLGHLPLFSFWCQFTQLLKVWKMNTKQKCELPNYENRNSLVFPSNVFFSIFLFFLFSPIGKERIM